ncbi:Uncharacterized protein DAT39_021867 [Clarias magur]|uniref:Uncharacterized protein n=1 Tax=Clarias magur TaxID=1594786 RepID=A0A8J4WQE5_CLAMG|nr:Uncharacterized protein DAT39_021867 [Clarias magur]
MEFFSSVFLNVLQLPVSQCSARVLQCSSAFSSSRFFSLVFFVSCVRAGSPAGVIRLTVRSR